MTDFLLYTALDGELVREATISILETVQKGGQSAG